MDTYCTYLLLFRHNAWCLIMKLVRYLTIAMAVAIFRPCYAGEKINFVPVRGVGTFYVSTPPGSVAFIPYATTETGARKAVEFHKFGRPGAYKIRRQDSYWFIVNHKTNNEPEATYLGVEVIAIYPSGVPAQTPVFLRRNANWNIPGDRNVNGKSDKRKAFADRTMDQFFSYHHEESKRDDMGKIFFNWHGYPANSIRDSWDNRTRWQPSKDLRSDEFRNSFAIPTPSDANMMVNGMLIGFETTAKNVSRTPVLFGFDGAAPIAAYLKIFSPDAPAFDREYFLTFE